MELLREENKWLSGWLHLSYFFGLCIGSVGVGVNTILNKHIKEAISAIKNEKYHGNIDKESWWKGIKTHAIKFEAIFNNKLKAEIAKQIADELFENGAGEKATTLVLRLEDGRDGGGWCKQAVIDIIKESLGK